MVPDGRGQILHFYSVLCTQIGRLWLNKNDATAGAGTAGADSIHKFALQTLRAAMQQLVPHLKRNRHPFPMPLAHQ